MAGLSPLVVAATIAASVRVPTPSPSSPATALTSPLVVAAIIAASVSVLTLIGTLAAQYFGRRATSRDTQKAFEEQRKQLDRTLAEQRTQTLNERFATAAGQLGSDKPAAVRLAGVYAMAGLADDWKDNRQTCIDVLCGYLRIPYAPDPGDGEGHLDFLADQEVRHTVMRVITAHLRKDAKVSWCGADLDFTGLVFDGAEDFSNVEFSGGTVSFGSAKFSRGGIVTFSDAQFSGGTVDFSNAQFSGGMVSFLNARFSGSTVNFWCARFSSGIVVFTGQFSGGTVDFWYAQFSGGMVGFERAEFSGGTVDFSHVVDWSHPPKFDWKGTPPSGVKLPTAGSTNKKSRYWTLRRHRRRSLDRDRPLGIHSAT